MLSAETGDVSINCRFKNLYVPEHYVLYDFRVVLNLVYDIPVNKKGNSSSFNQVSNMQNMIRRTI